MRGARALHLFARLSTKSATDVGRRRGPHPDDAHRQPDPPAGAARVPEGQGERSPYDEEAYAAHAAGVGDDIVRRQVEAGIDVINDGEMGKSTWITYLYERVERHRAAPDQARGEHPAAEPRPPALPGLLRGARRGVEAANRESQRQRRRGVDPRRAARGPMWVCTGPITYDPTGARSATSPTSRRRSRASTSSTAFLPVVAPASAYWLQNEHYETEEEFVYALADALHEEYKAIVDAGLLLQVDDAVLMHEARLDAVARRHAGRTTARWARAARRRAQPRAARACPEDRIRYHVCWGSWHGPHAYDPPLTDVIDLVLRGQRRLLRDRAGQPPPRARVADLGGRQAARGPQADPRRRHAPHQRGRAPRARRAAPRRASRRSSAART